MRQSMEEKKKEEGLYLHEWVYKKGTNLWETYTSWGDRHPKIIGIVGAGLCFDMAYHTYSEPVHKYTISIMNTVSEIGFVIFGLLFLYCLVIYKKPEPEVKK
jgi:hypothetical protein